MKTAPSFCACFYLLFTVCFYCHIVVFSKPIRTAAYCRVSTDREDQEGSYDMQVRYFTDMINQKTIAWCLRASTATRARAD